MTLWLALTLAAAPRFVSPGPDASTIRPSLRVFVEAPSSTTVSVGGVQVGCIPAIPDGGVPAGVTPLLHCLVPLRPGRQTIRALDQDQSAELTVSRLKVGRDLLPEGALGTALHTPEVEARCAGCHQLHEAPLADGGLALQGPCLTCHPAPPRAARSGSRQHDACLACHDDASTPRFAVRWPIEAGCLACHEETKRAIDERPKRHGPAVAGRCTVCHDAHGGSTPGWLIGATFELCTGCHEGQRAGRHVLAGFVNADSHPVEAWLDGGVHFTCSACHEPHAARSVALYRFGATRKETLCLACHPY